MERIPEIEWLEEIQARMVFIPISLWNRLQNLLDKQKKSSTLDIDNSNSLTKGEENESLG
jgi:hypothetical protein